MKIGQRTGVEPTAPGDRNTQISVRELLKREEAEPVPEIGKIRFGLYTAAATGVFVTIGYTVTGALIGTIQERPQPLYPATIQQTMAHIYHEMGDPLGVTECAPRPTGADISSIITTTGETAILLDAGNEQGSISSSEKTRKEIADKFGLSLVPNEITQNTIHQLITVRSMENLSNAEVLEQSHAIVGEYLMENFNLGFEFIEPSDPESLGNEGIYAYWLTDFIQNISALPKEAYDARSLWKIVIDGNGLKTTPTMRTKAEYNSALGTITFGPHYIGDSNTLIHELWHTYERIACADRDHLVEVFSSINPSSYEYNDESWITSYSRTDSSVSPSAYGTMSIGEDFAESGVNWAFNIDASDLNPDKLTVAEQKAMVAADWANNVAPGLAEYIATVSREQF